MKIVQFFAGALFLSTLLMFPSCKPSDPTPPQGDWAREADFPGTPRGGAFTFTIGEVAYVGMGYGTTNAGLSYQKDCYSFNGAIWNRIADFPGTPRERAIAFSIGSKAYVGTGYNRELNDPELKDFWEYDPETDQWTQLDDFGGAARYNAVGFADGSFGYVGTGYDGTYFNDFWKYDPANDSWDQFANVGQKRQSATIVELNDKFYLLGGINNTSYISDLWQFDPSAPVATQWEPVTPPTTSAYFTDFKTAVQRYDAVGFALDGKGYIATGTIGSPQTSVFQFDIDAGTWIRVTAFERASRSKAAAFVVNNRVFLGTGFQVGNYFDDVMFFDPEKAQDPNNN